MALNKRKHFRDSVDHFCTLSKPSGKWSMICKVTNLSEVGIGIDIEGDVEALPVLNSEVIIQLEDNELGNIGKRAVVIWTILRPPPETGAKMGLEFI